MKIRCLYDELISIKKLKKKFNPDNRNKHPEDQIKRLAQILEYQGVRYPAKISKQTGLITSGHGRILAAEMNDWKDFPINYQEYDNSDQEYSDVQADNAIASWSELDFSGINLDLGKLGPDFNIDFLGIKNFKVEAADKLEPGSDADEITTPKESICKLGDIWQLGKHRLMCGDSTSIDAVEKLMNGEKADMVFTDPPYGMNLDTDYSVLENGVTPNRKNNTAKAKKYSPVIGDDQDFDPGIIFGLFDYCKEIFLWDADYYSDKLINKNRGSWIVWDKRKTEELDRIFGSAFELCWSKSKHKRDIARITWAAVFGGDEGAAGHTRVHPTQKPIKLAEWFFERWGNSGDNVVDLFGGSGSTLIACEKTDRQCFMSELDPNYCDVIVSRWEKFTGKKSVLLNQL